MSLILGWVNRIDAAILSTADEIATLPVSNVQHQHLSRKWHTPAGVKATAFIVDLGPPAACAALALLGTNLTSSATLRVRASDADGTGAAGEKLDTGITLAGVVPGYGAAYRTWTSASARYWRIDISDLALPSNIQVGRVFLGPAWQPSVNLELDWRVSVLDDSTVRYSYGRQMYSDARPKRRLLQFSLDFMSEHEMYANAHALSMAAGITKDVLAIPDISSAHVSEQAVWGCLTEPTALAEERLGLFRQRFSVLERL